MTQISTKLLYQTSYTYALFNFSIALIHTCKQSKLHKNALMDQRAKIAKVEKQTCDPLQMGQSQTDLLQTVTWAASTRRSLKRREELLETCRIAAPLQWPP